MKRRVAALSPGRAAFEHGSDRVGRKPVLVLFTILMIATAYPALSWLVSSPSFARLLIVELWLSFIYGSYNEAMVVALTEIVPVHVRTSGFSVAYRSLSRPLRDRPRK
jgi:MHS family citrate/tricarballylate:H+ symporter-like MFS transporter